MPDVIPFEDLELGPLLGKGSFGRVYRGYWEGQNVAVKVRVQARYRESVYGEVWSSGKGHI